MARTLDTKVVKNPSKGLMDFVNKLRERKLSQLEELRNAKEFTHRIKLA